ncbi:MAG TPA: hypothetical protein DDW27_16975 [Bacteroidales bacterium]|nr:hypothetical protein [Bacteroidales bacterium]
MIMRRIVITFLCVAVLIPVIMSQEADPGWEIKFSGFVKTDFFYDTRQSSASNGLREGHFYLFPDNVLYDLQGNDINANPSFHILNIQTRIKGDISGPDAFGAKTSGIIEAEFFGTGESDINGFRLRHAYVKMDWTGVSLTMGQSWHPMFITESFPGTISFNTGAPFTPFSRNPQIRFSTKSENLRFSFTAYSQRDFTSPGPEGNSSRYLRNSGIPGLNLQLHVPAGESFAAWAGIDYKRLRPELKSSGNVETNAIIGSFSLFANLKIKSDPVNLRLMGIYAQNASDLMMTGGYAVSKISGLHEENKVFTNLNTFSCWADLSTNGKKVVPGLFTGYSKNLGSVDPIIGDVYGRGNNIDHLLRFSPRITVTQGHLSFAGEIEHTTAAYGIMQSTGRVMNTNNVSNLRILLSAIYRF